MVAVSRVKECERALPARSAVVVNGIRGRGRVRGRAVSQVLLSLPLRSALPAGGRLGWAQERGVNSNTDNERACAADVVEVVGVDSARATRAFAVQTVRRVDCGREW